MSEELGGRRLGSSPSGMRVNLTCSFTLDYILGLTSGSNIKF